MAKTGPGTLFVVDEKTGERKPYTGEVLATPPEPKGRVAQMLGDVPPSLKQSVAGIGSALVDAGNTLTGGRVDKLTAPAERLLTSEARGIARRLDDYAEAQQGQKSERLQQEEAELAATKGFLPSAKKVLTSPELLVSQIAQQVPILGVTVLGGRGGARVAGQRAQQTVAQRLGAVPEAAAQRFVRRAQVKGAERGVLAAGAGLGGSFAASDAIQQSLDLPEATWDQNDEFRALLAAGLDRDAAKRALAYRAALPAAAIGAGVNLAAGRLTSGLEARALTGQAGVTRDRLLSLEGARSVGSAVARGAAEEAITEGAEQFGANVGTAQIDPAQDLMAGVPEAAGAAAVTGGLLEGGFSAAGSLASRPRRSRAALEAPSAEAPNLGPQLPEVVSEVPEVAPDPPEVAPASPPPTAVQTTTIDPADGPLSKAVALDVAQQTGQPVQPVEVTQPLADPEPPPQNVDPATGEIRPLDQRQVQFLADLGRANGRLPTVAQIVKALGVSAEQAKEARRAALTLLEQQSTPPASSAPTPGGDHVQEGLFQRRGDAGDADRRAAGRPGAADQSAGQGGPQGQEGAQEGGQEEGGQEARAQGVASGEAPAAPAAAEDAAAARQESGDAAVPREGGARTADDLVKIETLYGNTVRVRKQDLDSDRKMLRLYTRDGTPVRGLQSNIHRSQLDPDGSKRAAKPGLPYYAVTTKQGDKPFKTERAAMLAVKRARQPEDAYEVRAVEGGFVAVRKPTAAADATRQQAGEPAAPSVAQAGASEASPRELSVPASERGSRSASAGQDAREGEGASSGPSGEASADAVERAARQGGAKPRFTYKVKPGRDGGFIVESDDGGGIVVARKPRGPAILDPVPPRVFKTPELARLFMQKKGLAEAADANVAQAEPNAETSAQSDDGAAQWSTLTPAGRRAALKQAGVDLPDAVLWSHISDANKDKLRPVVAAMREHASEAPSATTKDAESVAPKAPERAPEAPATQDAERTDGLPAPTGEPARRPPTVVIDNGANNPGEFLVSDGGGNYLARFTIGKSGRAVGVKHFYEAPATRNRANEAIEAFIAERAKPAETVPADAADEKARASTAASVDVSVTPAAEATPTPNEGTTDGNDSDPARSAEDGESRAEGARAGEVSGAGAGGGAFELLPPAGGSDARTDRGTGRSARRARARAAAAAEGAGDPGGAVPRRRAGAGGHAVDGKPGSRNFVLPVGGLTREGSWLETAKRNVDAIELALTLQKEGRAATVEEQERLAKYTGFGATELANKLFPLAAGQRPEHYNPDVIPEKGWRELGQRLKRLLTVDQLETVMRSTQYAHYTSETVTRGIWSALQRMGFKGGKVLEPGMGHGAFPMTAPPELAPKLAYTGIEMDAITAAIGKQLMQSGLVLNADYTKQKLPIDHFDLAIGNPPFASIVVAADPEYRKHRFLLHDYFFAKTIDRVRPGGILAFVTSAGTMNKGSEKARQYLAERADLLGAIRLPYTAFLDNAGTEVVTDILFLRKRLPGELPAGPAWMGLKPITLRNRAGREVEQLINEYFVDHPEMVLGEHALTGTMYRQDTYNVELRDDQKLEELLAAAVAKLPADVFTPYEVQRDRRLENDAVEADLNPDNRKEGGLYVKDGVLMVTRDGAGKPLTAIEKLTPKQEEWLKDAVALRDTLKRALHDQRTEGDWKTSLKQLEDAYHAFVGKHGRINEFTESERTVRYYLDDDGEEIELKDGEQPPPGVEANERTLTVRRYKNKKLLALDVESPLLMALETETDDGELVGSAQLTRRSIAPPAEPRIESTADALIVSLNRKGYLDIEHVAELAGVPVEQAIDDLGERIYKNPIDGQWVMADAYLSGDVVTALEEAEAAARTDPAYERNVEALKKVQPEPLTPRDITVALGATWLDSKHIEQFAREVLSTAITVSYDQNTGQWKTSATRSSYARQNGGEYSHADRSAGEILDAVLNNRDLRVTRTVREDGKTRTYLDTEATTAVNEIARKMRERFSRWVWEDAARAELLTKRYNALRNRIVPRQFVGDFIDPPGLSVMFKPDPISGKGGLHPHQKRAIWRQIQDGTTYLAHAVGAGKTLEMIIGGMEQKRLGLIAKPMYVVPNHMLGQFATEFLEAYPTANIMVADEETFVGDRRRQFIAAATVNAPDAIIITHSALKKLRVRPETMRVVMDDLIADLTAAIEDSGDGDRTTRKRLEAQLEKLMQRIESKSSTEGKDDVVYFEDIGVDFLYVDEAHEFRKLDFVTNRQGVKGISPQGSEKALDLYAKVRYLAAQRPGRSHVFASGTPVTNTLGELFTVQKFMDYDALRAAGLHHFDAWAAEYGELVTEYERNAAGQYRPVERFAKFNNLPELMMQVRQRMDVLTSSQLGELVKRPDLEGGKPQMVVVEASEALKSYMKDHLAARIEASLNWKPSRDQPHNPDPMLAIIGDARLAVIDMRFVDPTAPNDPNSKLNRMVDEIIARHYEYADLQFPGLEGKGGTQIVFSPIGFGEAVAARRGFDAKAWVNKRLRDAGIPLEQVAWMSDYKTNRQRKALFKEMRAARVRILFGSPANMGTGVNVQNRLRHLHYLSPPWYPSDVEQPHGRILRQGNLNPMVTISWYMTEGTYDATGWGMVARKGRFIEQVMRANRSMRSAEDISEVSSYALASALASGDDRAIRVAELEAKIGRLRNLQGDHERQVIEARTRVHGLQRSIERDTKRLERARAAVEILGDTVVRADGFHLTVGGKPLPGESRADVGMAFVALMRRSIPGAARLAVMGEFEQELARVNDRFPVIVHARPGGGSTVFVDIDVAIGELRQRVLERGELAKLPTEASAALGLTTRMMNAINDVRLLPRDLEQTLQEHERQLEVAKRKSTAPWPEERELYDSVAELERLQAEMAADSAPAPEGGVDSVEDVDFMAALTTAEGERVATSNGVKAAVERLLAAAPNAPRPVFMHGYDGLPARLREGVESRTRQRAEGGRGGKTAALYDPATGQVYLFTDVVTQPDRAVWHVAHEIAGHHGLRSLLGDQLDPALRIADRNPTVASVADAIAKQRNLRSTQRLLAVEEALAELAAAVRTGRFDEIKSRYGVDVPVGIRETVGGTIARFVARLKELLNTLLGREVLKDRDVRLLLEAAWQAADRTGPAGKAAAGLQSRERDTATSDPTQTPEFKRWFGDSKVVDADGKPLVVYHGTNSDLSAFASDRANYFTADPGAASVYAEGFGAPREGANVYPVYLSIQRPKWMPLTDSAKLTAADLAAIKEEGFDGVFGWVLDIRMGGPTPIAREVGTGQRGMDKIVTEAIPLSPEQIKSAIGNRGTFDPNSPSILESVEAEPNLPLKQRLMSKLETWRPALLGALTLRQLAEVAAPYLPSGKAYVDLVSAMQTRRNVLASEADTIAKEWETLQRQNRRAATAEQRRNRDTDSDRTVDLMHEATIAGVDPAEPYVVSTVVLTSNGDTVRLDPVSGKAALDRLTASMDALKVKGGISETARERELAKLKADHAAVKAGMKEEAARRAAYPTLVARFRALPAEWQALYRKVRDTYAQRSQQTLDALLARIEAMEASDEVKRALTERMRAQFESARVQAPYFPLARFGEFWASLERVGEDGEIERQFLMAETQDERDLLVKRAVAQGWKLGKKGRKIEQIRAQDGASGGFVRDVLDALGEHGVDSRVQDEIYQLYLRTLPDLSMRKHFLHRKKTPGFSTDALRAFAVNAHHTAHQLAKLEYGDRLGRALRVIEQDAKAAQEAAGEDADRASAGAAEFKRRHEWVLNPTGARWVQRALGFNFFFYLGLSPASALVNLTQTAIISYPALAARYGFAKALSETVKAMGQTVRTGGKISKVLQGDELRAWDDLVAMGAIDVTQAHDLAGIGDGSTTDYHAAERRAMELVSLLFHKAEVFNREATGLAAYRLAREAGQSHAEAVKFAADTIWQTHYDYSNANRARFMQGNVAKILLAFKQYAQQTTYYLWRAFYESVRGETPEVKRIARRRLFGTLAMTGVFSGVLGQPLVGMAFWMANIAHALFGDDDEPWDAETEFRNFLADLVPRDAARFLTDGMIEGVFGALGLPAPEISDRTSLSELWFRNPDREMEGRDAWHWMLEQGYGPVLGMLGAGFDGAKLINEGYATGNTEMVKRGIEKMVPKAARDLMKTVRYWGEPPTTLRGDPLLAEAAMSDSVYAALGFTPARLSEQYDINNAAKRYERHVLDRRSVLLDAYAVAHQARDSEGMRAALSQIRAFNRKHGGAAITMKTLRRSLRARQQFREQARGGIRVNPRLREEVDEATRFAEG